MPRIAWRATIVAALVLTAPAPTIAQSTGDAADQRLRVRVVPRYAPAPGSLRVTSWVQPDDRNRRLIVELDSPALYRSSELPLDGDQAARRHALTFTHLPRGQYEIRIRVLGIDTDIRAVRSFSVTSDAAR